MFTEVARLVPPELAETWAVVGAHLRGYMGGVQRSAVQRFPKAQGCRLQAPQDERAGTDPRHGTPMAVHPILVTKIRSRGAQPLELSAREGGGRTWGVHLEPPGLRCVFSVNWIPSEDDAISRDEM